ncbi:hypothetical protein [Brevundimonas sp.]
MSISPALITTIIAVAIGLVIVLVAFSSRLPKKVRRAVEMFVSIGYPAAVGALLVGMGLERYQSGETDAAAGFGVGAFLMLLLAARAFMRRSKA